jgi:glycerophosphoryl diester phosphodiesterase
MVMMNYVTLDYLYEEGLLPRIPEWFNQATANNVRMANYSLWSSILIGATIFISSTLLGAYNRYYLINNKLSVPDVYSHRGVDQNQGIQNTIEGFKRLDLREVDYLEIDVQETRDHQFVLMHDSDLSSLAGVKKKVTDLNLTEIKKIKLEENGVTARIPTVDEYLKIADQKHQKLLIELKIPVSKGKSTVKHFLKKYGEEISKKDHRLQSLSLAVVEQIKREKPQIFTSYIMPFNFADPPQIDVDAYTVEYSTLSSSFVREAHKMGKDVLAWTINSSDILLKMRSFNVDGIISDQASACFQEIHNTQKTITYSQKLWIYLGYTGKFGMLNCHAGSIFAENCRASNNFK